ncbi:hypothetical protein DAI22_06g070400 [Oryza sativa Japonica Group]|nr:hypothetical protein DAI22_06g070400 [Oryza sativa Japonica Group]
MEQSPAMKFPFIFTDESNRALVGQRASLNWSWRLSYGGNGLMARTPDSVYFQSSRKDSVYFSGAVQAGRETG